MGLRVQFPMQFVHIQILRFFAATAVVVFHSIGTGKNYFLGKDTALFAAFNHGDLGVDLFFVISGFIIYHSSHRSSPSPSKFLRRRIERIVPLYWFATISIVFLTLLFPAVFKSTEWVNTESVLKSLFFIRFTDGLYPVVYVGWSLEFEMFFYLSVALLMFRAGDAWNELLLTFSILVVLGRNATIGHLLGHYSFFTDPLMLEFAFGVLVAKVFSGRSISKVALFAVIGAALLVPVTDSGNRAVIAGVPATALVFAAAHLSRARARISLFETALGRLGDASYSIYLSQIFTVSAICKLSVKFLPSIRLDALIAGSTIGTILVGFLIYILVEEPVLNLCRRATASQWPPIIKHPIIKPIPESEP
jgi:exopolysaccharide production protein ExoZ